MFELPKSTQIKKPIHKKLIYTKFAEELRGEKKESFDSDISRIVLMNEISPVSVNIKEGEKISSLFVVRIELKTKEYHERNIILIKKLFKQNLLFVLHYENEYQMAIYETQLLKSEWKREEEFELRLTGLDLDSVWNDLVIQVSGISVEDGNTLVEQIGLEKEKEKLRKRIELIGRKLKKETQSKKKFELHQERKQLERELEKLG